VIKEERPANCVVTFSTSRYYPREDQCAKLNLVRLGATDASLRVYYYTLDPHDDAGVQYEVVQMDAPKYVDMKAGERSAQILVHLDPDAHWSADRVFLVAISTVEQVDDGREVLRCVREKSQSIIPKCTVNRLDDEYDLGMHTAQVYIVNVDQYPGPIAHGMEPKKKKCSCFASIESMAKQQGLADSVAGLRWIYWFLLWAIQERKDAGKATVRLIPYWSAACDPDSCGKIRWLSIKIDPVLPVAWAEVYNAFFNVVVKTVLLKEFFRLTEKMDDEKDSVFIFGSAIPDLFALVVLLILFTMIKTSVTAFALEHKGGGALRNTLRTSLMEAFLRANKNSLRENQDNAGAGPLIANMRGGLTDVVSAWGQMFSFLNCCLSLVFTIGVTLYFVSVESQQSHSFMAFVTLGLVTVSVIAALYFCFSRQASMRDIICDGSEKDGKCSEILYETILHRPLVVEHKKHDSQILEYSKAGSAFEGVSKKGAKYNFVTTELCVYAANVAYWSVLVFGPVLVKSEQLDLTTFIVVAQLFGGVQSYVVGIVGVINALLSSSNSLKTISELLNMKSENLHENDITRSMVDPVDEGGVQYSHADKGWAMDDFIGISIALFTPAKHPLYRPWNHTKKHVMKFFRRTNERCCGAQPVDEKPSAAASWHKVYTSRKVGGADAEAMQERNTAYVGAARDFWTLSATDVKDFDSIEFEGVTLLDPDSAEEPEAAKRDSLLKDCDFHLPLGHFYVVAGDKAENEFSKRKLGFYGLLSGELEQDQGTIKVPPFFRIQMINLDNLRGFLNKPLLDMLCCGHTVPDSVKDKMEVVKKACKWVGISESLLTTNALVGLNGDNLNMKTRVRVLLARALLADADVLIVHNVDKVLSRPERQDLYDGLKDWIEEDGLQDLPDANRVGTVGSPQQNGRRRRTVFVSLDEEAKPPKFQHITVNLSGKEAAVSGNLQQRTRRRQKRGLL